MLMLGSRYKTKMQFHVAGSPPWKPSPGPTRQKYEPARKELVEKLQREAYRAARTVLGEEIFFSERVALGIKYHRAKGRRDGANIIGGVADALQKILYKDDSALVEIHYVEETSEDAEDDYWIEVAKE